MSYSVYVGFGFHVNCYHSYRGDTCDSLGFGSDIRIIQSIIDTLDRCNAQGIPYHIAIKKKILDYRRI